MDGEIYDLASINADSGKRHKLQAKVDAAREHSEKLSNRLKDLCENRRARILAGEKLVTDATPDFFTVESGMVVLPPQHQETLIRMNRKCRDGLGVRAITTLLNNERVPTFSGAEYWSPTTVQKALENRATFGSVASNRNSP